jgi:hypothetical protein
MGALSDDEFDEWQEAQQTGRWQPPPGDALHACAFEKAGFRTYRLTAPDGSWQLVLSRVDIAEREPRGIVTVNALGHAAAFGDLDGYVMSRSVGVFGGRNLVELTKGLAVRLGASEDDWARRLDYLNTRALRELQANAGDRLTVDGSPPRPAGVRFVFAGRVRLGRTISLFGPGSSGKTTIAAGLVVSLTAGVEIIPGWLPTGRFRVGVLDWDEGQDEELVRLYAICRAHAVEIEGYEYSAQSRPLVESADEVGRWIAERGIEVLFVSPVNRALRAAFGDPGVPVFELYEILREFRTTNILIDHVTGAQVENREAVREYGSVAKRDAARGSYSIYEQSSEPGTRIVVLRNTKPDALAPRRAPEAVRITFEPAYPPDNGVYERIGFSEDVVADEPVASAASRSETQPDKLVRLLREHGPMKTLEVCVRSGFAASRVREVARKARSKGFHVNYDQGTESWVLVLPADPSNDGGQS